MTDPLDNVRKQLTDLEPIDMGPVPVAGESAGDSPDPGADPGPDAPDDSWMPDGDPPGPPDDGGAQEERIERAAAEPQNDVGNGRRFVIHFGGDFIFVPAVGWYGWTGTHWQRDEHQLATRAKAQDLHPLIARETRFILPKPAQDAPAKMRAGLRWRLDQLQKIDAAARTDDETAEMGAIPGRLVVLDKLLAGFDAQIGQRLRFAKDTGNSGRIDKLLQESSIPLAVPFEALDADPLEVNCLNGVLRFTVSMPVDENDSGGRVAAMTLVPHDRAQRVSKCIQVAHDPAAVSPLWDRFLARIQPDREMRRFLQRWFGLSMTAVKSPHLAFFHGAGANGKSVLVDTVARVLAGYAASLKIESITGTNRRGGADATPDLIPLLGARFVRTSEPDQGTPLQEGLIKQMTGGEPIQVRPMYGAQIDIDPTWKITMSGNHKPDVRGTDDGIWRRVLLVPFDVQIPPAERDEGLAGKLWAERAGILRWLVDGLVDYLEQGLAPPGVVREATEEYREESDPLGTFLMASCTVTGDPRDAILSQRLVQAVNYHFFERGLTGWKPATITRQMAVKSRQWKHPATGKKFEKSKASVSQYIGLRLTDDFARRFDAAPKDGRGQWTGVGVTDGPDPVSDY
jgi:putative DNA primase/helicase